MPTYNDLSSRMKIYYEQVPKTKLMRKVPVAIRIDGKCFHTFTRKMKKPFDEVLVKSMQDTMKHLCENIQGCVLGYTQSDEITLILTDYKKLASSAWLDYEVQKMCSIAASMATLAFNKFFAENVQQYFDNHVDVIHSYTEEYIYSEDFDKEYFFNTLCTAEKKGAMFDARCFNIPKEEVTNLIYWRQLDATRNSIQMVAQSNFSHKELQGKNSNALQNMLLTQKNINWNNLPTHLKRGSCCIKKAIQSPNIDIKDGAHPVSKWIIDCEIPIFKNEGRNYVEQLINL